MEDRLSELGNERNGRQMLCQKRLLFLIFATMPDRSGCHSRSRVSLSFSDINALENQRCPENQQSVSIDFRARTLAPKISILNGNPSVLSLSTVKSRRKSTSVRLRIRVVVSDAVFSH